MNPHILVTGGAGYVGSHACKALAQAGYVPVTLDNLVQGHRWAVRWGPLIRGDVRNAPLLHRVIREHRIEAVLHFAAHACVEESMWAPGRYFQNNVSNSLSLLQVMVESGVRDIVFSSTCATYGKPTHLPIGESHAQHPVNPYGESKLFVERALLWYEAAHGLHSIALRYFNAAGADPDGEIGEAHDPETHLIPLVIQTALGQRADVEVYGTDHPTPDGTAIRDYVHVSDLATAHVQALQYLQAGGASAAVNLGTGHGRSVQEVIEAVGRETDKRISVRKQPRRPGDTPVLVADSSSAARLFGWTPRYSDLATIVRTAWQWHSGARDPRRAAGEPL